MVPSSHRIGSIREVRWVCTKAVICPLLSYEQQFLLNQSYILNRDTDVSTFNRNLQFDLATWHNLVRADTIALWLIPLLLALFLILTKHWIKHPLTDATFFISIVAVFYFFVAAIDTLNLPGLRNDGWIFMPPKAGGPFYHFYSLYGMSLLSHSEMSNSMI